MRGARLRVEGGGRFEDVHGDGVAREEEGEEQAGGAGADYEDLRRGEVGLEGKGGGGGEKGTGEGRGMDGLY